MLQSFVVEQIGSVEGLRGKEVVKRPLEAVKESELPSAAEVISDSDRASVESARNGNLEAFRGLVEKYQSRAHSIAMGVIGNREDAEDIVQDAFLKAYRNLASFRGQSSFYTWFYRIVFNLAIDLSRKRYRRSESSLGDDNAIDALNLQTSEDSGNLLGHIPTPDQVMHRGDIANGIRNALNGLSPEHRAVIMLREIEGLSYSEISDVVGCSKGTVMSRLHHARKKLQRALSEFMPPKERSQGAHEAEEDDVEGDEDGIRR